MVVVEILSHSQITLSHKALHRRDEHLAVIRGRHFGDFLQEIGRRNGEDKDIRLLHHIVYVVGKREAVSVQFH